MTWLIAGLMLKMKFFLIIVDFRSLVFVSIITERLE